MIRTKNDVKNQQALFNETVLGNFDYHKPVNFKGKYIKTEKHQKHFRSQAKFMLDNFCNGEFWTVKEWREKTGFSEADRILRHINIGKFKGYAREEIKAGEHHGKYRIVKLASHNETQEN